MKSYSTLSERSTWSTWLAQRGCIRWCGSHIEKYRKPNLNYLSLSVLLLGEYTRHDKRSQIDQSIATLSRTGMYLPLHTYIHILYMIRTRIFIHFCYFLHAGYHNAQRELQAIICGVQRESSQWFYPI